MTLRPRRAPFDASHRSRDGAFAVIHVRPRPGDRRRGWLVAADRFMPCALGRGGVRADKREGDGATPIGTFRFREAFAPEAGRIRSARLPFTTVGPDDGWCDASDDRNYNAPVPLPYPASHETLVRADHLYDMVLVPDHNRAASGPGLRGRGSAVFVHLARPGYTPTEGCVALARRDMEWLWPRVGSQTKLIITL